MAMTKGQRIKQLRESLNLSQIELAHKVGIIKQTLYKYENEIVTNIPSDVIERLSDALGCSPAYIMGWNQGQSEKVEKALELYELYLKAIPPVQEAVDRLLGKEEKHT